MELSHGADFLQRLAGKGGGLGQLIFQLGAVGDEDDLEAPQVGQCA